MANNYFFTSGLADPFPEMDRDRRFLVVPPEAHTLPPGRYRINGRSVYWTGRVHIGLRYEPPKVPHTAAAPQPADERLRLPLLHRLVGWWQ